jgi:hypothetical protein
MPTENLLTYFMENQEAKEINHQRFIASLSKAFEVFPSH